MQVPAPTLIELSADWSPWKFQVQTFGEGKHYANKTPIICTGISNFETREAAEQMLVDLTAIHNRHL